MRTRLAVQQRSMRLTLGFPGTSEREAEGPVVQGVVLLPLLHANEGGSRRMTMVTGLPRASTPRVMMRTVEAGKLPDSRGLP